MDENLFVNVSSPSTSRFASVADLGPPAAAGATVLAQFLTELMSTRIGVTREGEVTGAAERVADDGQTYYDISLVLRSRASRNQLAENQERVDQAEFDARRAEYEETVTAATRAQLAYEEDVRRSEAAQRQWEADRARWEADVRACQAGDRMRCAPPRS